MTTQPHSAPILLPPQQVAAFAAQLQGDLITPANSGYAAARQVWNGVIDKSPALIVRPRTVDDVVRALHFARDHALPVTVRGGGHNVAGHALCEGVVLDLSLMRGVTVDAQARIARVEGGATWAEVDAACQAFGLATPGGVVSETGVAGLTLGGGLGWLRRKHGLSCDQVRAYEVVTAAGQVVRVSADSEPELFWALRGGGGGFGVVTAFEFALHPLGPDVMFAMVFYPASLDILQAYRAYGQTAPEEVSSFAICGQVPESDVFPAEAHGQPFVLLAALYAGEAQAGERLLEPLRHCGQPIADFSAVQPYVGVQQLFNEDYPNGRKYYWKSAYLAGLPDEALQLALDFAASSPSALSTVDIWPLGGAIDDLNASASAYPHRGAPYLLAVEANWDEPGEAAQEANVAWARLCLEQCAPYATGGVYLNFPGFEGESVALPEAQRAQQARLQQIKHLWDAGALFRSV